MITIITALVFIIRIAEIFSLIHCLGIPGQYKLALRAIWAWQVITALDHPLLAIFTGLFGSSTSTKECLLLFLSSSSWFLTSCTPCDIHTGA